MDLLDIILIAALGFSCYKGYKRGVFKALFSIVGYVVSFVGALCLYQPLALFLGDKLPLGGQLSSWVAQKMAIPTAAAQTRISDAPLEKAVQIINNQQLPEVFEKAMMEYVQDISKLPLTKGINTLGEGISYTISNFLIGALSFFLIYIGLSLVFRKILPKLFSTVSPKPVTITDKMGGAVLGFGGGLLTVTAFVIILLPTASLGGLKGNPGFLAGQMQNSLIVNLLMPYIQDLL